MKGLIVILWSLIYFFSYQTSHASILFSDAQDYETGSRPFSIEIGELNNDGNLDIAVTNYKDNNISVVLGNGDGTFQTAKYSLIGNGPTFMALGDFNGNRKLDIAVSIYSIKNIEVLLGNGDGTFQTFVNYSFGRSPTAISTSDLDGDGNLDLVIANEWRKVLVLLGNGDGTFQAPQDHSTGKFGAFSQELVIEDFNGDGKLDIAVGMVPGVSLSVLIGNGDGSFQNAIENRINETKYHSLSTGDLDNDGDMDLVMATRGIVVAFNNGDGTFQIPIKFGLSSDPDSLDSLVVEDFDSDDKLDIVISGSLTGVYDKNGSLVGTYDMWALAGNGDGTFQTEVGFYTGGMGTIRSGDFNSDRKLDLAGNAGKVLLNISTISTSTIKGLPFIPLLLHND